MRKSENERASVYATLRKSAILLAKFGFRVFPAAPNNKVPAFKGWQQAASDNPDIVGKMWEDNPQCNIAIAAGEGLLVVDVDMKNDKRGLASLDKMQHDYGELPETLKAHTPTGGVHLYFRYDADDYNIGNRASIMDGIDVRGDGGFVIAPPSHTDKGAYAWGRKTEIADAPEWLLKLIEKKRDLKTEKGSALTDTIPQILNATKWLSSHPPAIEGRGGDHHTYATACKLKDFGLSAQSALDLLFAEWNQKCEPPWEYGELETKVHNAYAYGENAIGSAAPEAFFEDDDIARKARAAEAAGADIAARESFKAIEPSPIRIFDPKSLPPRKWVLGSLALERRVTVLISPGGVGKSTLTINAALALATGREDIMQMSVRPADQGEPAGAWIFNNEDDSEELQRRVYAAMRHHDVEPDDLMDDVSKGPRLFVNSGEHRPFMVAKRVAIGSAGYAHVPADEAAAKAHIRANNIKMFVVDPFVETHEADENDNNQIASIGRIYRRIAQETNCAVILVHHTRKHPSGSSESYIGDQDSGRGAGALLALARVGVTLYGMTAKDAKKYRIADNERWRYIRLDDAKANLSPLKGQDNARWFKRESIEIETAQPDVMENVGALSALPGLPGSLGEQGGGSERDQLALAVADTLSRYDGETSLPDLIETLRDFDLRYADMSVDSLRMRINRLIQEGETHLEDGRAIVRTGGRPALLSVHKK